MLKLIISLHYFTDITHESKYAQRAYILSPIRIYIHVNERGDFNFVFAIGKNRILEFFWYISIKNCTFSPFCSASVS